MDESKYWNMTVSELLGEMERRNKIPPLMSASSRTL